MKKKNKLEAMLHPIRMRIIQSLINGRTLTSQQMGERLSDVATPTLYRHIKALLENKIIKVVQENQVRGTVEKVYALETADAISKEELAQATKEEHMDYFLTYMTHLLGQFQDYISHSEADITKDKVSFRQVQLYLNEEEVTTLFETLSNAFIKNLDNPPSQDREMYSIGTILIPQLSQEKGEKQ